MLPILLEFRPQLLLVSAGFDAALGDVQGKMRLSPAGFASLTRHVLALPPACAKAVVFEGGYHLAASADCASAVLEEMLRHDEGSTTAPPIAAVDALKEAEAEPAAEPATDPAFAAGAASSALPPLYVTCDRSSDAAPDAPSGEASDEASAAVRAATAGAVAAAFAAGGAGGLGTWTEQTLREVISIQKPHWACLRSSEHALAVETYFGQGAGPRASRKRGR